LTAFPCARIIDDATLNYVFVRSIGDSVNDPTASHYLTKRHETNQTNLAHSTVGANLTRVAEEFEAFRAAVLAAQGDGVPVAAGDAAPAEEEAETSEEED
jgi:hypothetical protein